MHGAAREAGRTSTHLHEPRQRLLIGRTQHIAGVSGRRYDLDQAIAAWTAAYDQAGSLLIDINMNNAQLTPGMSEQEVKTALAAGQTTDLITYFNQAA
ncbi:hypothetical protein WT14_21045 [Burkholderia stagnalis]|nr:hypothetical protein WT02_01480 [Burkholderia stagnalis]KVM11139.1 hypothetical protein WT04_16035 [Burkholderia stagnalis]KVN02737.1 hypothetical protein WT07_13965 [Burkholderia stagnalis]KVN58894.1 hypothetical protein WT14_21045 [Burkholderia stagnalis]KWH38271.1 hypothetical protein WT61_07780 [Burkholderia stagnalis]